MAYSVRQNPATPSNYTKGRQGATINKIIVHHAATTDFDGIGRTFSNPAYGTSAHYGVGQNQNVDQYVQETDIAWHAGNWPANTTSVGIENVNLTGGPQWAVADSTFDTLVELVRDIASRNGLLPLVVGKNLFGHKDFIATACPGQLYPRLQELADRVNGGKPTPPGPAPGPDQVLDIGSRFVFNPIYRVDNMASVGGIWQVQTNALCPKVFTWDDNGIPVMPLTEVDGNGTPTGDQVLQTGSLYKIPGTFTVLNIGPYQDRWMALTDMGGWKLWVDVETLTEV